MNLKYGLISSDSHAQLDRDAFTSRMSKNKWGEQIPHVIETTDKAHMSEPVDYPVERWMVNGKIVDIRGVSNCPAVMDDPMRTYHPQRWEEVPRTVYDPIERLKILDSDGVDAEVLFPNPPVQNATFFQGDAALELACVQAYNDALADWRETSERYIPLALIPYLSGIEVTVAEVERAVKKGHRGILMVIEPSMASKGREDLFKISGANAALIGLPHFNDPYWHPLWAACQDMDVPIHWHANGGIILRAPHWEGFTRGEEIVSLAAGLFTAVPTQFLPNLIFSGVLDHYPRLKWVWAETGIGWVNYVLEACDHEWERRHLWTEGLVTRPSELFRRQIYGAFWFEKAGIELRHTLGLENIMWESDYPHNTSTYPDSWKFVEQTLEDVPEAERKPLLYGNALHVYKLT
jgi:uncharacterized protein